MKSTITPLGQTGQPRTQAHVFAVTRQEAPAIPDVITNTFLVCNLDAHVLIDLRSTCSFIFHDFASLMRGTVESLGYDVRVSMPAGGIVIVNTLMRSCPLIVNNDTLYANLIIIDLRECDVILGMDWLLKYHVIIDSQTKDIAMEVQGQLKVVLRAKGRRSPHV